MIKKYSGIGALIAIFGIIATIMISVYSQSFAELAQIRGTFTSLQVSITRLEGKLDSSEQWRKDQSRQIESLQRQFVELIRDGRYKQK